MISARTVAVVVASLLVLIPACTNDGEQDKATSDFSTTSTAAASTTTEPNLNPGSGEKIRMGRAHWDSGALHAQIIRDLLEELGYQVDDPARHQRAPYLAYPAMAEGDIDFWANSWYPSDEAWWEGETRIGGRLGDHLARVDEPIMAGGGLQGLLVSKSWAEANDVTTLDQIATDEGVWSQLDYDGDGKGEIFGCPVEWSCDAVISGIFCVNDSWNLEQINRASESIATRQEDIYAEMFDQFLELSRSGQAAIGYVWAPTAYYGKAKIGIDTIWLSQDVDSMVKVTNPCGMDHGADYSQTQGRLTDEYISLDANTCLEGPNGCQIGWPADDIEITANRQWLAANPAAEALLNQVRFDIDEISALLLELENTDNQSGDLERLSEQWITSNQPVVDRWLDSARKAN